MSVQFAEGDVVQQRSGGPEMTVKTVEPGNVQCSWFDAKGKRHVANFKPAELKPVEPPSDEPARVIDVTQPKRPKREWE
ncbi:MAG: DUF2158 domain-containing protein [Sandaracinus sp.]